MHPLQRRRLLYSLALIACGFAATLLGCRPADPPALNVPAERVEDVRSVLFCHWNVENLFDDQDDGRKGPGDKEYDHWLANNPDILQQKLGKLCDALMKLNDG